MPHDQRTPIKRPHENGTEASAAADVSAEAAETLASSARPAGSIGLDRIGASRLLAGDALFITDERQRIRSWSSGAQRVLGFSADEVLGRRCYEIVMGREPEGHPVCSEACPVTRNARHGRGTAAYDVLSKARDGSSRHLSTSVLVLEEKRGSFRVIHLMHESVANAGPAGLGAASSGQVGTPSATSADDERRVQAEPLTRRELEVLRLFARGSSLQEIADALSITILTARNHATNIQHKLGVKNRLQMVLEGMRRGLI